MTRSQREPCMQKKGPAHTEYSRYMPIYIYFSLSLSLPYIHINPHRTPPHTDPGIQKVSFAIKLPEYNLCANAAFHSSNFILPT